jgi:hypothetical protein
MDHREFMHMSSAVYIALPDAIASAAMAASPQHFDTEAARNDLTPECVKVATTFPMFVRPRLAQ